MSGSEGNRLHKRDESVRGSIGMSSETNQCKICSERVHPVDLEDNVNSKHRYASQCTKSVKKGLIDKRSSDLKVSTDL